MSTFSAEFPPEKEILYPNEQGEADITLLVRNTTSRPARAKVYFAAAPPNQDPGTWLKVEGNEERDVLGNEAESFSVKLTCLGASVGSYGFRLVAANAADPYRDFTESKTVTFEVKEIPKPPSRWIIPAVLVVALIVVVGIVAFILADPRQVAMPTVKGKSLTAAKAALASAGLSASYDVDWK